MIRVGTSSWTDPTLVRDTDFYPPGCSSAEDRLRYYASIFTVVEVDSTFYAPPSPDVARLWVERTPEDFRMEIKAYALLTGHPARPATLWKDLRGEVVPEHREKKNVYLDHLTADAQAEVWARFEHAVRPLDEAGKLGSIAFQWPPWFTAKHANRDRIASLRDHFPDYPLACEFRHGSWMAEPKDRDRTLALLRDCAITYVCVDEPQGFPSSVPPVVAATTDELAMVRFHGQNAENWNRKGITAAERFAYQYDEGELAAWVEPLRELDEQARETHVVMNNCYRDFGVVNAQQLGHLLGEGLQPGAA